MATKHTKKHLSILWISDPPGSGFGQESENIILQLKRMGVNIIWFCVNTNTNRIGEVNYKGIKLFNPSNNYNEQVYSCMRILSTAKFDYIVLLQDPRYLKFFFRHISSVAEEKVIFWHLWDNPPFPKFNLPIYNSSDKLIAASQCTYKLLKKRINCGYVPLSVNTSSFFPIENKKDVEDSKSYLFNIDKRLLSKRFVIGAVHRNIGRKRLLDVIEIFSEFKKNRNDCLLLLRTDPHDPYGYRLLADKSILSEDVIIISDKVTEKQLNFLYNRMNVHLDISISEGFGLTVLESLSSGCINIVSDTGELTYRAQEKEMKDFVYLAKKVVVSRSGFQPSVYIYNNYVDNNDVLKLLNKIYNKVRYGSGTEKKKKLHSYIESKYSIPHVALYLLSEIKNTSKKVGGINKRMW